MPPHKHAPKPVTDTFVQSAGKVLQTHPFQPDVNTNQQAPQRQEEPEALTGGFDLTKIQYDSSPPPISPLGRPIQAKLTIGEPNDKYEQEADRVAHDVVQRIHASGGANDTQHSSDQSQTNPLMANPLHPLQRAARQEDEERLQKKSLTNMQRFAAGASTASAEVEQGINNARGSGQSLAPKLQDQMGQAMGADFSGVRVHTDARADQLNRSIQAKAFTTGQDIFFQQGAYAPGNRGGQELIAHELTHVVQQNSQQINKKNEGHIVTKGQINTPRKNVDIPQNLDIKGETIESEYIQRKFEATENFKGHSDKKFGINEEIKLSVNSVMAKQNAGKLEWSLLSGDGTLSSTNSDGSATFIAGDNPGSVRLDCSIKYTNQKVDSANFETVKPSGGYINKRSGTNLKKLANCWGVGFVGELFVTPNDVSFSNIEFREGTVAPVINGDWNAGLTSQDQPLTVHQLGDWLPILEPGIGKAVNQVDTEDWIETGTKSACLTGNPSGYIWSIPWEYKGQRGTQGTIAHIDHVVKDDGKGTATLSKGGVTVTSHVTDPKQWLFPISEDIARIKGGFPGQMTPALETWLNRYPDNAANIHYMMRNGQAGGKNLLQLINEECNYDNLPTP